MSKKKELGKGIRALLSGIESGPEITLQEEDIRRINTVSDVPLSEIEKNPYQPRFDFDPGQMRQLAASIEKHGIIQPLTIRKLSDNSYQLISGERRFRAAKMAGLKVLPAYIRQANDREMVEMALIENIHRADLNAIEIAISYQRLMEEFELTQDALSLRVGKERSTISNYVRLLKLPPMIQQSIKYGKITMGHARVLAGITDPVLQMDIYKKIINRSLSVRATEKLLKSTETKKVREILADEKMDPYFAEIEDELSDQFGTKVHLKRNKSGQGQILIRFRNDKHLNRILDRFKNS